MNPLIVILQMRFLSHGLIHLYKEAILMNRYIHSFLITLISLFPVVSSATVDAIHINNEDVPYFERIDDGLAALMSAAGECRSASDLTVYECLCAESTALQQMDSALRAAISRRPAWEGETLYYNGVNLQIPALQKQVEDVQKQCNV